MRTEIISIIAILISGISIGLTIAKKRCEQQHEPVALAPTKSEEKETTSPVSYIMTSSDTLSETPGMFTGFSQPPKMYTNVFIKDGYCYIEIVGHGTSNSSAAWTFQITHAPVERVAVNITALDNGEPVPAVVRLYPGSRTALVSRFWDYNGGWTASGSKGIEGIIKYKIKE